MTPDEFRTLLEAPEGNRIEFKTASQGLNFEELVKYCVALANEGGGKIVLGVTDKRPRQVIGTKAFLEPGRTEAGLFECLRQRIRAEEYHQDDKRVLIFHVPSRLPGTAWQFKGSFLMRAAMRSYRCPTSNFAGFTKRRVRTFRPSFAMQPAWRTSIQHPSRCCGAFGIGRRQFRTS